jgi:hypothetical protein
LKRTKQVVGVVVLGMLVIGTVFVMSMVSGKEAVGKVTFQGWTNVAGVKHAMVRFPPVTKAERKRNFFYFEFYRVRVDFEWVDPEGKRQVGFWGENVGRDPFANSTVDITVPVPTNATFFELTGARSWIERRWDNVSLPVSLPSAEFRFEPPVVRSSIVDTR